MRRSIVVGLLALVSLLVVWGLSTGAQVIDPSACQEACNDQRDACITACGERDDPVECEGHCENQFEECSARC